MQLDGGMMKLLGDPQSLNFYSYTRNNPVNLTDPTGRGWLDGVSNFISGVSNAVALNEAFGTGRKESSNFNFNAGQVLGDAISFGIGLTETVLGLAVAGATLAT